MITGKELWIDGLNEGIITRYNENEDGEVLVIETKRENASTYETDIRCYFSIENYVSAKVTDKKIIVKTYITR